MAPTRCFFADGVPSGLAEAAEDGWGMDIGHLWQTAHARYKRHDDGTGKCRVCGCALDFDAWIDERDELEAARLA